MRLREFVWQQLRVGVWVAVTIGLGASIVAIFKPGGNLAQAILVSGALTVVIILATLCGSLVPLLFRRLGIDPAVAAGPLVTMTSDALGILVYFGLVFLMFQYLVPGV